MSEHETSTESHRDAARVYAVIAAVWVLALTPWAARDIHSLDWLWDPRLLRIVLVLLLASIVVITFIRSRRQAREDAIFNREIGELKANGDATMARISEKLDRLAAKSR